MTEKPISNFHIHTYRCKHAEGDIFDYCEFAISSELEIIGFADHTPLPEDKLSHYRMYLSDLPGYVDMIEKANKHFDSLTILKGMECDYFPRLGCTEFYKEILFEKYQLDYLIGSVHNFPSEDLFLSIWGGADTIKRIRNYAHFFIKAMESGIYSFMAHPDLFRNAYMSWDKNVKSCIREIFVAAKSLNMPLEINTGGYRKFIASETGEKRTFYPTYEFWNLAAEYNITVVINSDAHKPANVNAYLSDGIRLAAECGLQIISTEELKERFYQIRYSSLI